MGPAPGVQLNFGGIAKGDAAHEIAVLLDEAGFEHYLVNMGGDVVARGSRVARPGALACGIHARRSPTSR